MTKGFDCASVLTLDIAKRFKADGFTHACRYLVPAGWKRLTKREVDDITIAGLKIVSIFETTADRCRGGAINGVADGKSALQCALALGQTKGSTIYFAVDYDTTAADTAAIQAYLNAAALQIYGYEIGVYGEYSVIESMKGVVKHYWQTKAWSGGLRSPSANIYQSDCGPKGIGLSMNGIQVDLDDMNGNEGGWNADMIPVADANKIIANLSQLHGLVTDKAKKDEIHDNANYLRNLSGQTPTK